MNESEKCKFLTQSEAATLLGRTVRTLTAWRRKGYGPAFHKIGGAVMYSVADISEFLSSSRTKPHRTS